MAEINPPQPVEDGHPLQKHVARRILFGGVVAGATAYAVTSEKIKLLERIASIFSLESQLVQKQSQEFIQMYHLSQ